MFNLGYALTWLVFASTAIGMGAYAPGVRREAGKPLLKLAHVCVYISALGLIAAAAWLMHLFVTHQFQYDYVSRYSSLDMPFRYVVSAFWGGQEGTFLLWAFYGGLLGVFLRFKARHYEAPVLFFYMGINLFLLLMLLKASPFSMLDTVPADGRGLNPLLQDPWMTIHPPVMFFGFASLGIPAAYAMAAMVKHDWDHWVQRSIPWTIFGVIALGTGLVMGGYWAYSILGWGGFWGWDPVENSSLVPWLVAVALLHTQIIQLKRQIFRRLNLLLALLPFVLVTYSTFLTRSGVLADFSVHSFTDLGINQFLVAFMAVFLGGGFLLFLIKVNKVPTESSTTPLFSREYFLFLGSLVFGLFALVVLLGTSAPILTRLVGPPSNVQPEFYNKLGLPISVIISLLLGFSPFLFWNVGDPKAALMRAMPSLMLALISVPVLYFAGVKNVLYLLMLVSAVFAIAANTQVMFGAVRRNWKAAGGYLAHVGIGLAIVGILTSTAYSVEKTVVLPRGQEVKALGYGFTFMGIRPVEQGRKDAYDVALRTSGGSYVMSPTMFFSDMNRGMMKKPAIQSFLARDVYISPIAFRTDALEDRIESRLMLGKDRPVESMGVTYTLRDIERTSYQAAQQMHGDDPGHSSGTDYTAVIDATADGETTTLRPVLRAFEDEHTAVIPADVPGAGSQVTLITVKASGRDVEIGVAPRPLALTRGETGQIGGFTVTLTEFHVNSARTGGSATVTAHTVVSAAGTSHQVSPGVISRPGAEELELIEAPIANTGLNLVMSDLDPQKGIAYFQVAPIPQEYLYAEASTKPFIALLWAGTMMTLVGLIVATLRRASLVDRVAARIGTPRSGATLRKNGKRTAA